MKFDFLRVMRERNSLIAAPGKISGTCKCNALVHCTACSNVKVDGKAECSFTEIQRCVNSVFSFMKEYRNRNRLCRDRTQPHADKNSCWRSYTRLLEVKSFAKDDQTKLEPKLNKCVQNA